MAANHMELQKETLLSVNEYMKRVISGIGVISDRIEASEHEEVISMSANLIEGLQWLKEAISLTSELQTECGIQIKSFLPQATLTGLMNAYEARDYVQVGYVLENELKPHMVEYDKQIDVLVGSSFFKNGQN